MNKTASERCGLLAGGNWIVEQVKLVDLYPQPGHLAHILSHTRGTGGAPYNVLVDLAKSGVKFPLFAAGLVGDDADGHAIIADCKKLKIDTRFLATTNKAPTSFTDVITERGSGRRTFFHAPGANAFWTAAGLDFRKTTARLFHLGYLLLLDALDASDTQFGTKAARLLAAAQAAGLRTSIDVVSGNGGERFTEVVVPALKFVDYCILDETDAGRLAGFKTRQPDGRLDTVALRHAAGALLQKGVRELVVIHFPEGAFARTRKGEDVWQSSVKLPAKNLVSPSGAGDAFCAGVLLGLHEGWDLQRCLLTGVCIAAAALSDLTCTSGVKSLSASLALGKKFRFNPPLEPGD